MRVSSRRALVALAALLALSSTMVDAVANCADCPSGKTCLFEDKALSLGAGQSSLPLKFCNFDASKKGDYKISFRLKKPLACDPNGTLMPEVSALTPQDGCSPANCVVTATLKQAVDWAILIKNDGETSVLQAKLDGNDEVVQVAQGTADAGTAAITGGATDATVCSTSFSVKAARLSRLSVCNKVTLCRGKPADTACTTPVPTVASAMVDNVSCAAENCGGTITLDGGLPCEAATAGSNAVLVSVTLANGASSPYASIATLSSARAATIASASGVAVGSTQITIKSDATCPSKSLNVTVDGLALNGIAPANGTILISLTKALTSTQAGSDLGISVSQCGVASKSFTATVGEMGSDALTPSKTTANTTSGGNVGDVSPPGARVTQEENADTGLPNGMYIGIGVGALAFLGFFFECWYHRRRHRKEHGVDNSGATVPV